MSSHAALDWYPVEVHPVYGKYRWSGPNPNPIYWLPVRIDSAFYLRIHVIAFADAGLIRTLGIEFNDVPAALTVDPVDDGTYVLTVRPRFERSGDGRAEAQVPNAVQHAAPRRSVPTADRDRARDDPDRQSDVAHQR